MPNRFILPVPYAMGNYGFGATDTYKQIISVNAANSTMSGVYSTNLLENECHILEPVQFDIIDDLEPQKGHYLHSAMSMQTNLAYTVKTIWEKDTQLAIIGGDHTISIGTGAGLSKVTDMSDIGIIWVDAHGDFNTPETSASKSMTGYPLAVNAGLGPIEITAPFKNNFVQNIVHIGVRDIDPQEEALMKQKGLKIFSALEVEGFGIADIMDKALKHLQKCRTIWLSVDIDSLDACYFEEGETDVPITGGLTPRELLYIVHRAKQSRKCDIMELVQLNDMGRQTNLTVLSSRLLEIFFGLGSFRYGKS